MSHMSSGDASTPQYSFLSTIAQGCPAGLHFLVAQKVPDKNGKDVFPAEEWREQHLTGAWYFSTGASDHKKLRRRNNLKALRAVVLDDIGTKVDAAGILAKPTWRIETSAGNYQWGFLLEWTDDIEAADALVRGLIDAGLQDKGVNRAARLFRLPGSLNNKPGRPPFNAVLHEWEPGRVYTLASLTAALKVEPGDAPRERAPVDRPTGDALVDDVFLWLHKQGFVGDEGTEGWWQVECPWPEEHTTNPDKWAKYLPRAFSGDGEPGVMCHHGHGDDGCAYKRRFFHWVHEQGGPLYVPPSGAKAIDPGFGAMLLKLKTAAKPKPQVRLNRPPTVADVELYNVATLQAALGNINRNTLIHLDLDKNGAPLKIQPTTYANVMAAMESLGVQSRLNLMNAKSSFILPESIDMARFGAKTAKATDDLIEASLLDLMNRAGMKNKREVRDCFARLANDNYWHPAKDWIESAPWDGVDRFEALASSIDTPTPDLLRVYLRRWCLQGIEAACGWTVRKESQKSLCFILAGKQGIGKTRWLMSLAPGFSCEGKHLALDSNGSASRDSKHEALQGWIVELGELDTTFRKTAQGSMKAFLSGTVDEYRLPYADAWLERPRCANFCGSVNDPQFLQDVTGNRRFAALWATHCNPEHGIDMQQFWAQVKTWWDAGEQWWLADEEERVQAESNERFQTTDGIVEQIGDEIANRKVRDVYTTECGLSQTQVCLLLNLRHDQPGTMARIGHALREHMGEPKDLRHKGGGPRSWRWFLTRTEVEALGVTPLSVKS